MLKNNFAGRSKTLPHSIIMNRNLQANFSTQQKTRVLFQMTELALTESASLISTLGHCKVRFTVDSIGTYKIDGLDGLLGSDDLDMLAVCHRVDGHNTGEIIFLIEDSAGLDFIKDILHEKTHLKEMSEMEEEVLLEIGNIIVNDFLSHYVEVLHKSVTTSVPSLRRGQCIELLNQQSSEVSEKDYYIVKFTVELESHTFIAYILWLDHLCELDLTQAEITQISTLKG